MWIDAYAYRESLIHRWEPRSKLIVLISLMFLFSMVQKLHQLPWMLVATLILYRLSRLPLRFLWSRLRYPGIFLSVLVIFLPLFAGETVWIELGIFSIKQEGVELLLIVVCRFLCILTVGIVLFGTAPFLTTLRTLQRLGLSPILVDILFLTWRYLFEIAEMLAQMQKAMRLRGFQDHRFSWHGIQTFVFLIGTLFVRSYEQSERIYKAMRLRGYSNREKIINVKTIESDRVLILQNVQFGYPDKPDVLTNIQFTIKSDERVGLIGPNGAGKTSLFLLITGLLKPQDGEILLFDQPVKAGQFRQEIGMVFQNPNDQLFSPTVWDDVAFGLQNLRYSEDDIRQQVDSALNITHTIHLAERPPHHLSGGEKRMVAIAGVIAMRPRLVIYDEPDANLDSRSRRRLIQFLQNTDHAIFIASHDLEFILEVCERVIVLDQGHIVADGNPREVMGDAAFMETHGLEKPHSLIPHSIAHHSLAANSHSE